MGCNTLPPSPPDLSDPTNQLQLLSPGTLYVYDIDSNCSGCVIAINLCYRPDADTTNSSERVLAAVLISLDRIIVYTHDVYVDPVSDRQRENCITHQGSQSCCVTQTLQPSERFFVSGHDFGLRTYNGVSSLWRINPNSGNNSVSGGSLTAPTGQYNNGSSVGNIDLGDTVHLPMFYFNITSGKKSHNKLYSNCGIKCLISDKSNIVMYVCMWWRLLVFLGH